MIDIYCDAFLCSCPTVEEGPEKFDAFITGILLLREIPNAEWLRYSVTRGSIEALCRSNRYPIRPNVERAIGAFGREEIEARDVIQIVDRLLSKDPPLEEIAELTDFLYEDFGTNPAVVVGDRGLVMAEAFEKFLLFAAFHHQQKPLDDRNGLVVTRSLDLGDGEVTITGALTCVDSAKEVTIPYNVLAQIPIRTSWNGLCDALTTDQAWLKSLTLPDYYAVMHIHLVKMALAAGVPISERQWAFGHHFVETMRALGFGASEAKVKSLLRACGETILRRALNATHALRVGAGPNDAQLVRGNFKAWRRDIDYEFHLHYWDDGVRLEIACVVVHNDFSIPS